jgi:nicotinate-nucleotide pyrophosphorylase (carboxylating)
MSPMADAELDPPRHLVRDAVARALAEDLGELGDLTAVLVPAATVGVADFVTRADGVLAGTACAAETFAQLDPGVLVRWSASDGDAVGKGQAIGRVEGPLRSLLTGERTALNFLCHLSGVATITRRFVDAVAGGTGASAATRVWDTRKTLPGLRALEKAAVRAGGGVNHRGSLADLVLVKDNHLGGTGIRGAVARARELWPGRGVEVECDRPAQVEEAVAAGADIVLLDNMDPEQVRECVAYVRANARSGTLVEVSGGVTLETAPAYAAAGADLISSSVITQSAPALDIGLDLALE